MALPAWRRLCAYQRAAVAIVELSVGRVVPRKHPGRQPGRTGLVKFMKSKRVKLKGLPLVEPSTQRAQSS